MFAQTVALALFAGSVGSAETVVLNPKEAVSSLDEQHPRRTGQFEMTVASTGNRGGIGFLNSSEDYRASDNLTFRLSPDAMKALALQFGETPEHYLNGKHIVVKGILKREVIVNEVAGRVISFNRWQYVVRILSPQQIISVQ